MNTATDFSPTTGLPLGDRKAAPIRCKRCGMRADADPFLHAEQYGHDPVFPDDVM